MFTAPTAFRAIKKDDPAGALIKNYDLSNFKALAASRNTRSSVTIAKWIAHIQNLASTVLIADDPKLLILRGLTWASC
jgi:hypothetical protein